MIPFFYETAVVAQTIPVPTGAAPVVTNTSSSIASTAPVVTALPTASPDPGIGINIAGQAAIVASDSVKMNPVLDWSPFLGLPIWLFITIVFLLLLLYVIISWIFKLRRMGGVKGYVVAADKGTQEDMQTWIFGKTKKLTIECLKYWGGMIHFPGNVKITKWRHASIECTMKIGGQPAVAVSEDYDHTRDFVSEIALCYACEQVNKNHKVYQEELRRKGFIGDKYVVKPISSFNDYKTYGRRVLEAIFPDGITIPSYSIFNHTKFRKYFPKGRDGDLKGGIFLRKASKLRAYLGNPGGLLIKAAPLLACIIFVAVLMFGAMYVPLGK